MGDAVRLLYIHVPVVTVAYVGFATSSRSASVMYLWKKSALVGRHRRRLGRARRSCSPASPWSPALIWGRPTWGIFWVWDARLTATAMLFLLLLGYLAVRRLPGDQTQPGPALGGGRPAAAAQRVPSTTGR